MAAAYHRTERLRLVSPRDRPRIIIVEESYRRVSVAIGTAVAGVYETVTRGSLFIYYLYWKLRSEKITLREFALFVIDQSRTKNGDDAVFYRRQRGEIITKSSVAKVVVFFLLQGNGKPFGKAFRLRWKNYCLKIITLFIAYTVVLSLISVFSFSTTLFFFVFLSCSPNKIFSFFFLLDI